MKNKNIFSVFTALLFGLLIIAGCGTKKTIFPGKVIILNGPSCVGKTSIIKALQAKTSDLWLEVGIDKFFIGVVPPKWYLEDRPEHHKVMSSVSSVDAQGNPIFTLHVGPEGQQIIRGMHWAIAAYAKAGCNVIVDYICYEPLWQQDLLISLAGLDVLLVGLSAPLEVLEERERARATSPKGHTRSHHASVHNGWTYNLRVDTAGSNPEESAAQILQLLSNK